MTDILTTLRINMTGRNPDPAVESARWRAAVDMADFADKKGFAIVNVEEHHCAEIGWLPSPLTMAALIVSRTRRIQVRASALLINLYDPIRLAEDIAILDLASGGRFTFTAGQGYRPIEYHALDKDFEHRGEMSDFILETLLKAWSGEPFDYRGRTIRVTPTPFSRPHPPFCYGGMSRAAVRRAARFGLPFLPPAPMPELEALYYAELERHGTTGHVESAGNDLSLLFIDEDPQRAWAELGRYFLAETAEYSGWRKTGVERRYAAEEISIDTIREQKIFEIITPDECLARARRADGDYRPILHPLAGGVPVERAWQSLELYVERVLKRL